MATEKVKIISCKYNKKKHLIIWEVIRLKNNTQVNLACRDEDLPKAMGLEGTVTEDAIERFCATIGGKEVNWQFIATHKHLEDPGDMSIDKMWQVGHDLYQYPFTEVSELEE